jgi:hypothetical protein
MLQSGRQATYSPRMLPAVVLLPGWLGLQQPQLRPPPLLTAACGMRSAPEHARGTKRGRVCASCIAELLDALCMQANVHAGASPSQARLLNQCWIHSQCVIILPARVLRAVVESLSLQPAASARSSALWRLPSQTGVSWWRYRTLSPGGDCE